jgi:hypothetical protein
VGSGISATLLHYRLDYQEGQGADIGNWNTLRYLCEHQEGCRWGVGYGNCTTIPVGEPGGTGGGYWQLEYTSVPLGAPEGVKVGSGISATVLHYWLDYQEGQGADTGNWNTLQYLCEHQEG